MLDEWNDGQVSVEVLEEILDEKFLTRTHGAKATYFLGCRGPLCRKKERDAKIEKRMKLAEQAEKEYTPRRSEEQLAMEALLLKYQAMHYQILAWRQNLGAENESVQEYFDRLREKKSELVAALENGDSLQERGAVSGEVEDHSDPTLRGVPA